MVLSSINVCEVDSFVPTGTETAMASANMNSIAKQTQNLRNKIELVK